MGNYTPMMKQYFDIKEKYNDCLVFFRLGDFYELFFDDAITASKELDITLTGRDCGMDSKAPMCGVPFHSVDSYIAKLVEKNYKVAICEQLEDPKATKTIVKRDVVRVITKGTILDQSFLDESKNNYIMCIYQSKDGYGISIADVSTGEFLTTELLGLDDKKIIDEIGKYNPSEIIVNADFSINDAIYNIFSIKTSVYYFWAFDYLTAYKKISDHFKILNLEGFGIEKNKLSIASSGALLIYLCETQKNSLYHIMSITPYYNNDYMNLDISSRKNLELTETIREKSKKGSLLWVLDKTKTAAGARLIRKWIESPLTNKNDIEKRLDSIEELKNNVLLREEIKEILTTILDIQRIMSRITFKTANARDLIALKNSIINLPSLKLLLSNCSTKLMKESYEKLDTLKEIFKMINQSIVEEPPFTIRDGNFIKEGFNSDLDRYKKVKTEGNNWILELESREKERTGIKNLKIKFNKVFGYYIEITNSYLNSVPKDYTRRQTVSNGERFTIDELKKIEIEILNADEKMISLEYDIFQNLLENLEKQNSIIQKTVEIISNIDVIISLSEVADKNNYIKPELNIDGIIDIKEGRHPVVELMVKDAFISNDTYLDLNDSRLSIITGPNMAGKSTYMRQSALIVLLAQIGSFVPADFANIGLVDRIFTRVGASDDLATGQSTFMIEMTEVANILNNSTKNSLLILDEIGRGTSTFDGLSIAWSVLEYIADKKKLGAKTLFATHYHELTELEGRVDGVKNYCITVEEQGEDIIFLRKIIRGGALYSYGIHVAKIAGLPKDVINRANVILDVLNEADVIKKTSAKENNESVVFYGNKKSKDNNGIILNELLSIKVDELSGLDALKTLYDIQEKIKKLY